MSKFFLALLASSLLVQPALVSAKLQFLTTGPDACTPDKIKAIKAAMVDATRLADAAITALAKPDVIQSQSFIDFLGTGNSPAAISAKNYQSVKTKLAEATSEIAFVTGGGPNDIVFICPPHIDQVTAGTALPSEEVCKGMFSALARNGPPQNIVRVCPVFFAKQTFTFKDKSTREVVPTPLDAAAKLHVSGGKYGSSPAMTILHELQHLKVAVGDPFLIDVPSTIPPPSGPLTSSTKSYSVDQCKGLAPADKLKNAQNPTWFAMDVFADPSRGRPCGSPPGSPKPPAKPLARRGATNPPASKPKVAAPKAPAPKKVAAANPAPVVARPPVAANPPAAARPPVGANPPAAARPPVAANPVAAKPPVAPAPKPNPLGAGSAPSGPRLARPARLSSTLPTSTPAVGNGAKIGVGAAKTTSSRPPTATPGRPAGPLCNVLRRSQVEPLTPEGDFVR